MDEKQYMIDNEPASARDLIKAAKRLDNEYGTEFAICTTSQAAAILPWQRRKCLRLKLSGSAWQTVLTRTKSHWQKPN